MLDVAVKNLLFDAANGIEIFDTENDRVMTKAEVDAKIKELCFQYTGLNEKSTDKEIKRALKSEGARDFFAVIEEIIEVKVTQGLTGIDIFDKYVEEIIKTDLGTVMDKIFNEKSLNIGKGGISFLTHDVKSRINLTEDAFVMALVKFINGDIWK